MKASMDEQELRRRLGDYKFYHIIQLTDQIATPGGPEHVKSQQPVLAALERLEFQGKRVLDVGCRDGLYSFFAERKGAEEIIGIDHDISQGAVELLIPFLKSKVQMHSLNVLDLTAERFGKFDVIIFAGVLYHLRHPFWTLKLLRDVMNPGGAMVLETAVFYGMDDLPMLYCPVGDGSPYEPTSCTFFNRTGMIDTLTSMGWEVLRSSLLHPEAEGKLGADGKPVIDRAIFECRYTAKQIGTMVENYWMGTHDLHSRFGGDVAAVEDSGLLNAV